MKIFIIVMASVMLATIVLVMLPIAAFKELKVISKRD
jgi:hypothetical protein